MSELAITEQGLPTVTWVIRYQLLTTPVKSKAVVFVLSFLFSSVRVFAAGLVLSLTLFQCAIVCVCVCSLLICRSSKCDTRSLEQTHNKYVNVTRSVFGSAIKAPQQILISLNALFVMTVLFILDQKAPASVQCAPCTVDFLMCFDFFSFVTSSFCVCVFFFSSL